jgi:hypothetical protein
VPRGFAVLLTAILVTMVIAVPASAAPPSPPFTQCPAVGADTSCALLIYINSAGAIGVAGDPSQGPYDSIEDTLIGVQNNSSFSIGSIPVSATSGKDLFGFDQDGLCAFGVSGCPFGPTGYEGPGVSFTNITADLTSGTVNFSPAIQPGGHAYFSLEEALATVPPFDLSPGPPVKAGPRYVALGDSFSSGEGNPPFLNPSNTDGCHRSNDAYPEILNADSSLSITHFEFAACSGATRRDVQFGSKTESSQLGHLDATTDLVTLSVGGDDVGFGAVLKACATGAGARLFSTHGNADCQNTPATNPDTGAKTTLDGRENALIADLATDSPNLCQTSSGYVSCARRLAGLYYDIAQASASNVHIVVLLYPHLFTNNPDKDGCDAGSTVRFSQRNVKWLNAGVDLADAQILKEVAVARTAGVNVTAVDPRPLFNDDAHGASPGGHGVCTKQPWIYGTRLSGGNPVPYSFHPRPSGQQAFARGVTAAIGV